MTNPDQTSAHDWLKTALVMIMTMREDDAERWDPEELVEFARSFSLDALGFSVGGVTAFYPTELPLHPRSPSLGERDLVGETLAVLKQEGMKAIARIDLSLVKKAAAAEHPDWIAVDRNDRPISVHGHYVACPNAGYYREFGPKLVREILSRYEFDGLWANAAQFSPWHTAVCYCGTCRRRFREATGKAIPEQNWLDPVWREYNELRYLWIADWNRLMHDTIHSRQPQCAWLPLSQVVESWDHSRAGGWDLDYTEPHEDGLVLEAQRRYTNLWWPGVEARYARALAPEKAAGITVSYFMPWWRLYAVPRAENRIWTAQIAAHGARPWLHVSGFYSEHFDRRGLEPMRETFGLIARNRDAFDGVRSLADTALVYSRFSQDNIDGRDPEGAYIDHFRGAYNALLDQRIPFDVLSDKRLAKTDLDQYRAVLLPNAACLPDEAIDALTSYVKRGGRIICSFATGTRKSLGQLRDRSFIHELLDVEDSGAVMRNMRAAYAHVLDAGSPVLQGIDDTDLIPIGGDLMFLRGKAAKARVLAYVPPVEGDLGSGISVPEFNAIDRITEQSLMLEEDIGDGSAVYFPWEIELTAYKYGLPDLFRIIGNSVRSTKGWQDSVEIEAPGLIDLALMGDERRLVVTVINFSAPGSFNSGHRRTVTQVMPLTDVIVRLRLPAGRTCVSARLVVAGQTVDFGRNADIVDVQIPRIDEFETVLLELK